MKRTVRNVKDGPGELSPITSNGQPVFSTIREITDYDTMERYIEEYTPEPSDAVKVLEFLDTINGIGWTGRLKQIEKELRAELMQIVGLKDDR